MRNSMKATYFITLAWAFFAFTSTAIAHEFKSTVFIDVYLFPWDDQLLNKEAVKTIRDGATLHIEVREKIYAQELLRILRIDDLLKSSQHADDMFKTQLVIDVNGDKGKNTYLSDGKMICTKNLMHCLNVDKNFKQRFDPTY